MQRHAAAPAARPALCLTIALGLALLPWRAAAQEAAAGVPPAVTRDYQKACDQLKIATGRLYEVDRKHFAALPDGHLLLVTAEYAAAPGYQGPPNLAILLAADGTVKRILLLHSADTKLYLNRVTKKLGALAGQKVSSTERPVLAVTGATRSAQGISATVNGTLDAFSPVFARLHVTDKEVRYDDQPLAPVAGLAATAPQGH
jgi:hypothetical protein